MMQSMGMGMGMSPFDMFDDLNPCRPPMNPMTSLMSAQSFMSPMSMMMMNPLAGMQQAMSMAANGSNPGYSYCTSSVTSYTTDEHGRPQVYQQSQEVKSGPDGLKETKSAVRDSRSGRQEMAIGHHLHNKAHIKKKAKNAYTGEEEQGEEFVNLEENEADQFEHHWTQKAKNMSSRLQSPYHRVTSSSRHGDRLALTSSALEDHSPHYSPVHHSSHKLSSEKSSSKKEKEKKKRKKSPSDLKK